MENSRHLSLDIDMSYLHKTPAIPVRKQVSYTVNVLKVLKHFFQLNFWLSGMELTKRMPEYKDLGQHCLSRLFLAGN